MDSMPWQVWDRKWLWAWRWCWLAAPRRRWSWQALFPAPSFSGNWLLASLWGWTGMFTFACLEMSYFAHNPPIPKHLTFISCEHTCEIVEPLQAEPTVVVAAITGHTTWLRWTKDDDKSKPFKLISKLTLLGYFYFCCSCGFLRTVKALRSTNLRTTIQQNHKMCLFFWRWIRGVVKGSLRAPPIFGTTKSSAFW